MAVTLQSLREERDIPVVIVNQQGQIDFVNAAFEKVFGWSSSELKNQSITVIIPANMHDAHHLGFSRFLSTEKPAILGQPLTLKAVNKNKDVFDAEHFIIAEKVNGAWQFGASIRPL